MNRMKPFEEVDCEQRKEDEEETGDDEIACLAEKFLCINVHNRDAIRPGKMVEHVEKTKPVVPFEYEFVDRDSDNIRTVVATPNPDGPWIDPISLKLKYRIGRGTFGDVRLATLHRSSADFDEYHELALKMLHLLEKDHTLRFMDKFQELSFKSRGFRNVCWLHGITIIDGKICIAMKVYEGSVGDKVARLKGGKLQLSDALRYGIGLAKGVIELHSVGMLVLNLKPTNILLDDTNNAVLGDFGIPYLLLGMALSSSDMLLRLGTPSYIAPEQWEPEVRGPVSFETDSWGFACCFVEMLVGVQPWAGKSIDEIYNSVVINREKPQIPTGLPPAIERVINGCFEYDIRNRPLVADILHVFESSQNTIQSEGEWFGSRTSALTGRSSVGGYTTWYLAKDQLRVGDSVRSRKPLNTSKPQNVDVPEGTLISLESEPEKDGFALVKIPGVRNPVRVLASTIERVTAGFSAGDWVRLRGDAGTHSPIGILHSIQREGNVSVGFIGLETLWRGNISDLQIANPFYIGQFVRLKENICAPRFRWPRKSGGSWATGRISQVLPNGCLVVGFPGRFVIGNEPNHFQADPAEVELVSFDTSPGIVQKYHHIEDFHWAVRPLVIAFGLFTAMKFSLFVGRGVSARVKKGRRNAVQLDDDSQDGQSRIQQQLQAFSKKVLGDK